jgi:hypothetical protein
MLLDDLAGRGQIVSRPEDPLGDGAFIAALGEAYKRTPSIQPSSH